MGTKVSGQEPSSRAQDSYRGALTGSVSKKKWSSGSTLRYLKMELDQNLSMWSCKLMLSNREPSSLPLRASARIQVYQPSFLFVHAELGSAGHTQDLRRPLSPRPR